MYGFVFLLEVKDQIQSKRDETMWPHPQKERKYTCFNSLRIPRKGCNQSDCSWRYETVDVICQIRPKQEAASMSFWNGLGDVEQLKTMWSVTTSFRLLPKSIRLQFLLSHVHWGHVSGTVGWCVWGGYTGGRGLPVYLCWQCKRSTFKTAGKEQSTVMSLRLQYHLYALAQFKSDILLWMKWKQNKGYRVTHET